jgi:REP-associated tyrosine transposase
MVRPLRVQFANAHYHVTGRGNEKRAIFVTDVDRHEFLALLEDVSLRLDWSVLAYCLMGNHYHLFLKTRTPTLSIGMQNLNGDYAQAFNRRHQRVGHLFQGRFDASIVDRSSYFLELVRYIVLNPVRAGLCQAPEEWRWSSHLATIGRADPIKCLDIAVLLSQFDRGRQRARRAYQRFIAAGIPQSGLWTVSENPAVIGDWAFAGKVLPDPDDSSHEVTRQERRTRSLRDFVDSTPSRNEAIRQAYASGTYSMAVLGRYFGLHYSTVSKICRERRTGRNDN